MQRYKVPDMSCAHCVQTIERAIAAVDPVARVTCNLATKEVAVETQVPARQISEVLAVAGYENTKVTA